MAGITEEELNTTLDILKDLVNRANLSLVLLQIVPLPLHPKFICQVKIELDASEHLSALKLELTRLQESRVLFLGAAGSGKTTLLSVLSDWGALDDGRGKMRTRLLHHRHELLSGSTSSVTHQPLVFLNNSTPLALTDDSVLLHLERRREVLNEGRVIQLVDSAGKLRFDRTVFSILTSSTHQPNLSFVMIEAPPSKSTDSIEIPQQTIDNIRFLECLGIPVAILVSKIDQSCTESISTLLEKISEHLDGKVLTIYDENEAEIDDELIIPVLLASAVSGDFLSTLAHFLYTQTVTTFSNSPNRVKNPFLYAQESAKSALIIEQVANLVDIGPVVYGQVAYGTISTGDLMILGPQDRGSPVQVRIKSIQRLKCPVNSAKTSQHVSIALQFMNEAAPIRRGMALLNQKVDSNLTLKPLKRIIAEVEHISGGPKARFYGTIYLMGQRFSAILQVQPRAIHRNSVTASSPTTASKTRLVCLVSFAEKRPASVFLFPGAAIVFISDGRKEKFAGQVIDYFA